MKTAYAYLRSSGLDGSKEATFKRQEETIRKYAKRAGFEIQAVFCERVSGTKGEADRAVFTDMITDMLSNGCRTIIVESLDRLARELMVQQQVLVYLISKGIDLWSAMTGECVTEAVQKDPIRKAMIQIQGTFAELDKSLIVRRLRKGREAMKQKGKRCEGQRPYGQRPGEEELVRMIRRLRRKPRGGGKRRTLQQIADTLNEQGIFTRKGTPWGTTQIYRILNPKGRG